METKTNTAQICSFKYKDEIICRIMKVGKARFGWFANFSYVARFEVKSITSEVGYESLVAANKAALKWVQDNTTIPLGSLCLEQQKAARKPVWERMSNNRTGNVSDKKRKKFIAPILLTMRSIDNNGLTPKSR